MKPVAYGHVLFYTSAAAFRAEKLSGAAGIPGARLIPTPRELSSDCGVALRFMLEPGKAEESRAAMEHMLLDKSIPFERIVAGQGRQAL
jgi:hypothetical protein